MFARLNVVSLVGRCPRENDYFEPAAKENVSCALLPTSPSRWRSDCDWLSRERAGEVGSTAATSATGV
jgi:hypothetical protein